MQWPRTESRISVESLRSARSQARQPAMERLWSRAGAASGNWWHMGMPEERLKLAKPVATGCDQLPIGAHGKEGGSAVRVRQRALQKLSKRDHFWGPRLARVPICGECGVSYGAFSSERPLVKRHNCSHMGRSGLRASVSRALTHHRR